MDQKFDYKLQKSTFNSFTGGCLEEKYGQISGA